MSGHDSKTDPSRRRFLAALGSTAALTLWPGLSPAASGGQTRLVVVLLRGAMDGLHLLPPRDDADYLRARGQLAVRDALALDSGFGLHPKMAFAHQLYRDKQLLPMVAVAPTSCDSVAAVMAGRTLLMLFSVSKRMSSNQMV